MLVERLNRKDVKRINKNKYIFTYIQNTQIITSCLVDLFIELGTVFVTLKTSSGL